jgi:hypothetical protein
MKMTRIAMLILAIALVLYILIPSLSWAGNGTPMARIGNEFQATEAHAESFADRR